MYTYMCIQETPAFQSPYMLMQVFEHILLTSYLFCNFYQNKYVQSSIDKDNS